MKQFLKNPNDVDVEVLKLENEELRKKINELENSIKEKVYFYFLYQIGY